MELVGVLTFTRPFPDRNFLSTVKKFLLRKPNFLFRKTFRLLVGVKVKTSDPFLITVQPDDVCPQAVNPPPHRPKTERPKREDEEDGDKGVPRGLGRSSLTFPFLLSSPYSPHPPPSPDYIYGRLYPTPERSEPPETPPLSPQEGPSNLWHTEPLDEGRQRVTPTY